MKQQINDKGESSMKAVCRIAALVLAAFFLLFPSSARAEIKEGTTELNLFGGYHLFDNSQNLKDRPVLGGRIGYNFTKHFGIEWSMDVVKSRVDDDNLTPYLVGGIGLANYSPSISTKNMAVVSLGAGAKYRLSDHVSFRMDFRDQMVTEVFQETFHNFQATIGFTYVFGGGKAKPVPVQAQIIEAAPEPEPVVEAAPEPEPVIVEKLEPRNVEPIIIIVTEPEVEKKVIAIASEPMIEEKIIVLAFEDINFDFDSSALTVEAREILKRNIQILNDNPRAKVRIAGYTSASGTDEYNQKLSERRANAVREYLNSEGLIMENRLTIIGYGEDNPETYEVAPKDLYSPAAMSNMRVLFEIVVK